MESTVAQAQAVAGDKNVGLGAASIVQQRRKAGLLDAIQIDLGPNLLGNGVRLFEHLAAGHHKLEPIGVIAATGVTRLQFRMVK